MCFSNDDHQFHGEAPSDEEENVWRKLLAKARQEHPDESDSVLMLWAIQGKFGPTPQDVRNERLKAMAEGVDGVEIK